MVPKMSLLFYTVRKLINRGATSNLSNMVNKLHPADIAQVMQQLGPSDRFFLFGLISLILASMFFSSLTASG